MLSMRKIAVITFLLFMFAQAGLVLHTMEHGLADHEHSGKKCEACLFAKELGNSITPNQPAILFPQITSVKLQSAGNELLNSKSNLSFCARAPPSFS